MHTLQVGQPAPDFALPNQDGDIVRLADYRGRRLVVYVYPRDNTPGCTRQAVAFRDARERLNAMGVSIVGISRDSVASHKRFHSGQTLNFDILSDVELGTIKAYGAWGTKTMYGKTTEGTIRTTVIVDADGIVTAVFPKVKLDGHIDEVIAALS
jgi:peroxiredoxin Q/BCP